jgi:UDP-glucose 4-epimerase
VADLKGKRILVTGGAGFIGSHIVDLLCDEGCIEIVAVDNMVRGRPENLKRAVGRGPVRLVDGDIRDSQLMALLVKGADIVFHQAALRITHCAAEPRQAMEVMRSAQCRKGYRRVVGLRLWHGGGIPDHRAAKFL